MQPVAFKRTLVTFILLCTSISTYGKRHALLIKLSTPTNATLERVCHLPTEALETDFSFPQYRIRYSLSLLRNGTVRVGLGVFSGVRTSRRGFSGSER
jgi:hypothetical protein